MPTYLIIIISFTITITIYYLYKKNISDIIKEEKEHKKISKEPDMKPKK